MCKVFTSSLKGPALIWFSRLPPRSVDSFQTLTHLFMTQFASSRRYRKDPDDLFRVQQQQGEPLRDYIQRFNDTKVEIMDCPEVVACNAFKRGLLPGTPIYDYMVRKKPRSLLQTLQKAQTFVVLEEETRLDMQRAVKEGRIQTDEQSVGRASPVKPDRGGNMGGSSAKPLGGERVYRDREVRAPLRREEPRRRDDRNGPTRDRLRKFGLTVSPAQVVAHMEQIGEVRWPQPMNLDPRKRDNSKWCAFHRERGHSTEECRVFKREIEELLKREYLRQLVSNPDKWGPKKTKGETTVDKTTLPKASEAEKRKVINSIHGGTACGGEQRGDRRAYARIPATQVCATRSEGPDIIFTAEDSTGTHHPHGDALVVTLDVGNWTVKRILVDNGSSADIIFLSTLEQMGISPTEIQPTKATLVGYDGNESAARGKVTLPVTTKGETRLLEMIVVDAPSAYNLILG